MSNTPSDADIVALTISEGIKVRTGAGAVRLVRAALAKWGTPQPVAREPLTDEQVDALIATKHFREGYELTASDKVCINWYRLGLRDGERAHGITQKGGS